MFSDSLSERDVKRRGTPVGEKTPTRELTLQPAAAKAGTEVIKSPTPLAIIRIETFMPFRKSV